MFPFLSEISNELFLMRYTDFFLGDAVVMHVSEQLHQSFNVCLLPTKILLCHFLTVTLSEGNPTLTQHLKTPLSNQPTLANLINQVIM